MDKPDLSYREPVYTIGIVAKKLDVSQATLRIWERKALIRPARLGKNRFYSQWNLDRLKKIKQLLQQEHINIEGVKRVLASMYCWDIKKCKPAVRKACSVFRKMKRG
jgi:MerR family transcriptional regulator/heat shock protein HspR